MQLWTVFTRTLDYIDPNNFYNIMYRYMYSFDIDHSIIDKKKFDWYIWKWINIIKLNMLNMRLFSDFNKKKWLILFG